MKFREKLQDDNFEPDQWPNLYGQINHIMNAKRIQNFDSISAIINTQLANVFDTVSQEFKGKTREMPKMFKNESYKNQKERFKVINQKDFTNIDWNNIGRKALQ